MHRFGRPRFSQRPDQFQLDYRHPLAKGLVFAGLGAHAGGTRYHDSSAYQLVSTSENITSANWTHSIGRNGLDLNGSNQAINLGDSARWNLSQFTMAAWVVSDATDRQMIFGKDLSGQRQFAVAWDGGNSANDTLQLLVFNSSSAVIQNIEGATALTGLFAHVAVVWDGTASGAKAYLDGVLDSGAYHTQTAGPMNDSTEVLYIGRRGFAGFNDYFDGRIFDPVIYNRTLSPAEIRQLANPGNVMLSGLVLPPKRAIFPGFATASPPATTRHNRSYGVFRR